MVGTIVGGARKDTINLCRTLPRPMLEASCPRQGQQQVQRIIGATTSSCHY